MLKDLRLKCLKTILITFNNRPTKGLMRANQSRITPTTYWTDQMSHQYKKEQ